MNKALARSVVVGMGVVFAMGCQEITPSEVESPNFSHSNGIWIEIVECWGEEVKDEVGGGLGTINIVCATRVVFIPASTTTPDEPPPPPDDWDEDGGAPGDGEGEDGGPTDEENVDEFCTPSLGNVNNCLRPLLGWERDVIDLARSQFKDPNKISDFQQRMWCEDGIQGTTVLYNERRIWAGRAWPNDGHDGQTVPANRGIDGRWGVHIDDDVLRQARTSSRWRERVATALLHEVWHETYSGLAWGEHGRHRYNIFGEPYYTEPPYSEVKKCLK